MDLVRNVHDAQAASKILVDHALARFSTDNLSCMIVRFDNKLVQETVEHKVEPIGVDGDAATHGSITESQAIIANSQKTREEGGGDPTDRIPADVVEVPEPTEPEVELNPVAVEAARKDHTPEADAGTAAAVAIPAAVPPTETLTAPAAPASSVDAPPTEALAASPQAPTTAATPASS